MVGSIATYAVKVAWSSRITGVIQIGVSTIGSSDVISAGFGQNAFDDISADVTGISISRGFSADMLSMQQGRAVVRLYDPTGKYNPENASSTLHDYLLPMRPLEIIATHDAADTFMFYGFISRIEHDPEPTVKESIIEAVDLSEWLAYHRPVISEQTNQRVGTLLGLILDDCDWRDPAMRYLDPGGIIPSFSADGSDTALSLISALVEIDRGFLFVNVSGVVNYYERSRLWRSQTVVATYDGSYITGLRPGIDVATITNGQTVTRTGGSAQTYTDTASQQMYGYRDGTPIESAYLGTDGDAASLARWIVVANKDPRPPGRRLEMSNADEGRLEAMLATELATFVRIDENESGTDISGWVRAVEHEIGSAGNEHTTWISVEKRPFTVFTIGVSLIGGPDIIGF